MRRPCASSHRCVPAGPDAGSKPAWWSVGAIPVASCSLALNVVTGQLVRLVRERCRTADTQAFVEQLGRVRPRIPKLLVWDNAPPHHPKVVRQAAEETHIQIAFLPFRAPELMPCEDLWRQLKAVVAANRAYADVNELAQRAVAWLDTIPRAERLRRAGVTSSKFNWLPT